MKIREFSHLASIYGGDIDVWPLDLQDAAATLARNNATARAIIDDARKIDFSIVQMIEITPTQEKELALLAEEMIEKISLKKSDKRERVFNVSPPFSNDEFLTLSHVMSVLNSRHYRYLFATLFLISTLSGGLLGSLGHHVSTDYITDIICSAVIYEDLMR
ncbi:hypothetical protein [Asaia sp. VD9]|uniref:hypothetical protein n=1 Tax=Asaia sp. VD9 TaxID=3081235 RepID=UPI003018BAB3